MDDEVERLNEACEALRSMRECLNRRINEELRAIKDRIVALERPGIKMRKQALEQDRTDRHAGIWQMRLAGHSLGEIATRYDISKQRVYQITGSLEHAKSAAARKER
jgi:DNA invertase Pin-like site-specific DNA recombinase